MGELRAIPGGNGNGGLGRTGAAVVSLLALLGGCLLIGWGAATKYQSDLAEIRAEQAFQGLKIDLVMAYFKIPQPERHK